MQGYNAIDELYRGNIRPAERSYHSGTPFAEALEACGVQEMWFTQHLSGEAADRFAMLLAAHNEVVDIMCCENFRNGFQVGTMLMIDAVSPNESTLYDLAGRP